MRKEDAVRHFGTAAALAEALGITPASVSEWGDVIPEGRAYQLQVITAGVLRVEPSIYQRRSQEPAA